MTSHLRSERKMALVIAVAALLSLGDWCDPRPPVDPGGLDVSMNCVSDGGHLNLGSLQFHALDSSQLGTAECDDTPGDASIQVNDPLLQMTAHYHAERWNAGTEVGFEMLCEHDITSIDPDQVVGLTCIAARSEFVQVSRAGGTATPTKVIVGTRVTRVGASANVFYPPGNANVEVTCFGSDPVTIPENGSVEVEVPPFATITSCWLDAGFFGSGSHKSETPPLGLGVTSLKLSVFARLGGLCGSDADCAADLRCAPDGACQPGEEGDACASSYVPATGGGDCNEFAPTCYAGTCRNGSEGDGCFVDQECASGLGCATTGVRAPNGVPITSRRCMWRCDATHPCAGDLSCVDGLCHDGSRLDPCATHADCVSPLLCDLSRCVESNGDPGDPCSNASQCDQDPANHRYQICSDGHCSPPLVDAACEVQNDCGTGLDLPWVGHGLVCIEGTCQDGSYDDPCSADEECLSFHCNDGRCDGDSGDECHTFLDVRPKCYAPWVCVDYECDLP